MSNVKPPAMGPFSLDSTSFCTSAASENPTWIVTVVISGRNENGTSAPRSTPFVQAAM